MDKNLPHYTREKLLGEGGMGKVFLATDNQLQRKVAIKELNYLEKSLSIKIGQDENVNHALKEARLLARVNHTNIIQIYNILEEDNKTSLVMEYFNSKTLTQFQNETMITLVQKLDLLSQLAAGLAQAHQRDIIHCDLKPNNILVNEQGKLKIADFGIACLLPNSTITFSNNAPAKREDSTEYGCLFYMSPEQIQQQVVDYRSDVFSLGIIAYQLIVGSHPFGKGSTSAVSKRICEQSPEHAKHLMINAPSALTDLLMEMLVKPVEQRTLTASAIENRLKHIRTALIQSDMNEQATLVLSNTELNSNLNSNHNSHLETAPSQLSRHPVKAKRVLIQTAYSIFLLCLIFAVSFWLYSEPEIEPKQVVILKPTLVNSPLMAAMQQDLVISAVEDALRQSVINTKNMYLVSQREVNSITKKYPDDLNKLKQAVGASDIISTVLACDNTRCKISFSRLVVSENNVDRLTVKSENNWIAPIEKFNAIYSTSQTQFATLYPEFPEVNQSGLMQRPINEDDYRDYIRLYSKIISHGEYSAARLIELKEVLVRSPYLYHAYSLFRETSINLYNDSQEKSYLVELELLLDSSPPEYKYSIYEAIDRFWLAYKTRDLDEAQQQIIEAKKRGAKNFIIAELNAILFFASSQYQDAAQSFLTAIELRPSTTLLYNLAFTYWRMGELEMSANTLNKLFEVLPNEYQAQQLQANIWLLQGKLSLAIKVYEQIVTERDDSKNMTNLSLAYALNKQYKKALEFALLALNKDKEHPFKLINLADIEMILGNKQSAVAHYQKVVDSLKGKGEVKYLLGLAQAYGQLGNAELAIDTLVKAQALAPNQGEVSYTSALVYSLLNENVSAIHHVKAALENKVGVVWFNLPWFNTLCKNENFQQIMLKNNNPMRCSN